MNAGLGRHGFLYGLLAALTGCLLEPRPVDEILARDGDQGAQLATDAGRAAALPLDQQGASLQREVDDLSARALLRARAATADSDADTEEDVAALLEATRALFSAADLRIRRGTVAALTDSPDSDDLDAVLDADDELPDEIAEAVLSLSTTGLELAERAARDRPDNVGAQLHRALHLSMVAWANGPMRSLFAGLGPKLQAAIDAAVALDPEYDDAGPLRLQGRFLSRAPWPYGDSEAALEALERAVESAPVCINHLFLGDALHAAGRPDEAIAQWRAARDAPLGAGARYSGPFLRAETELRLRAFAAPPDR